MIEQPGLAADPRFVDNSARMQNLPALIDILTQSFSQRDTADWLARLQTAGVPASPVLSIGEMLEDPQVLARDMVVEVEHSRLGTTRALGSPVKFSATPTRIERGAPLLGEHTREILAEFGYADAEIAALIAAGAVVSHDDN